MRRGKVPVILAGPSRPRPRPQPVVWMSGFEMEGGLWGGTTGHIKVGFLLNIFLPCFWFLMERELGSVCKMGYAVWHTWLLNIKRCSVFKAQFCYDLLSQESWNYSQLMSGKTYLFNVYFISVITNMSSLSCARFKACLRGCQNSLFPIEEERVGKKLSKIEPPSWWQKEALHLNL